MVDDPMVLNGSHFGTYAIAVDSAGVHASGNPFETFTSGIMQSFEELLTSPTRIKRPAARKSFLEARADNRLKRGEDEFVDVSWDEALDLVAHSLSGIYRDKGPASIFGGSYGWASAGRFHHAQSQLHRFLNTLGGYTASKNTYSHGAAEVLLPHIVGTEDDIIYRGTTWPVIAENTEYIIAFGGLPAHTGLILPGAATEHSNDFWINECARRGTRLVTIAPSTSAYDAILPSRWIALRPNTDTALMLGLAHVLYTKNWHDAEFLRKYTVGFEKFLPYLLGTSDGVAKDAAWAGGICGLPAELIEDLAGLLHNHRCLLTATFALQRAEHGEQPFFMLVVLAAMSGQIGLPGGGFSFGLTSFNATAKPIERIPFGALPQGTNPARLRIPVACITDMLERPGGAFTYNGSSHRYPTIEAIYWAGGNPFHHHQDLRRLAKAWKQPKLVVCNEIEWNAMARHADIVLPVCSTLERNDIMASQYDPYVVAMKKVSEPIGQSRCDFDIFCALAERMGVGDAFSGGHDETGWLKQIYENGQKYAARSGIEMPEFDEFWRKGVFRRSQHLLRRTLLSAFRTDPDKNRLRTKSGKIEIFCQALADMKLADCPAHPVWLEPKEWLGSKLATKFPLHLLSPQPRHRLHGQLDRNGASAAAKINGREPIYLNPKDARDRKIRDGDTVRVFNERGTILCGAKFMDELASGTVLLETGAWFTPSPNEDVDCDHGNPNVLTADRRTSSLAQACAANSTLVQVELHAAPQAS